MERLFLSLLNSALSASWLILAVLVLRQLLQKAPKNLRCLLWGLVGLRLALPVRLKSALSLVPSARPVPPEITTAAVPAIQSGIPAVNQAVNPALAESLSPAAGASVNPAQVWTTVAAWVWLAGLLLLLLYALLSTLRLRRRMADSVPERENIRLSDKIDTPFVLGVFRPRIYLPFALQGEDRELVIAHEQCHIARGDHRWKPLGFLLLAVYWFHPLCWLAYVLFSRDLELACDERVIRGLDLEGRKAYSRALLSCSAPSRRLSACPVAFGETGVKGRIASVLRYRKPARHLVAGALVLCALAAVCFFTDPVDAAAQLPAAYEEAFIQSLEADHSEALGYTVLSRAEYVARYGDNLAEPAYLPAAFTRLDRVYVWPEDRFPAVKQVWYDAAGQQAVFVIQQNGYHDDGLPFNLFGGYSTGQWRASLPWANWFAADFQILDERNVTLQYYAADYEGAGTRDLPRLRQDGSLTPTVYNGPIGNLSPEAAAETQARQEFLMSVWDLEQVGSLYSAMDYESFYNRYGLALAALPELPERFRNTGFVYVWDSRDAMNKTTVRILQIWADPERQEAVCISQAALPSRNSHSESGYVKLNRSSAAGSSFPWDRYPWLVYQYQAKFRLGENVDTTVRWYGPEDLGEEACRAMLGEAVLIPPPVPFAAVQEGDRDGSVYLLSVGEMLPLREAFGLPVTAAELQPEDEAFVSLAETGDGPVLTALAPTESGRVLVLSAEYEGRTLRIYVRVLPVEEELKVLFYGVELENEFTIHLSDGPVLLYATQGGEIVDAQWQDAGDGSLILTPDPDGCYVGPGDRVSPAGGTALTVRYGQQEKTLTVHVVE